MKLITVRDIMTPADKIVMISPYATVRELINMMDTRNVRSVIVDRTSEHDAYGIVTYSNILQAIYSNDGDMDLLNVYDVATKPMVQIVPDLDIRYAAQLMINQKIKYLSVTWEGRLTGVISMTDIAEVLMDEAKQEL
ncbi:MAG: CBS domain-containing protein [Campylobacterales bacterium]|jgi:signal-transduction protein with cAMP-binding, CBS, and nucleotidyltransferase domain